MNNITYYIGSKKVTKKQFFEILYILIKKD